MRRETALWITAALGLVVFLVLAVAVSTSHSLGIDSAAFDLVADVRASWLDRLAKIITTLGLFGVVAPFVALGAFVLVRRGHAARGVALAAGAVLTWLAVWLTKAIVGRPRPPASLVHTSGHSYPSGHAANSVGWAALGLALGVLIARRGGRRAALAAGCLLAGLVGLSRIYLRAHYASDVIGGEALAVAIYAGLAAGTLAWRKLRRGQTGVPADTSPGRSTA